jgi:hypothetical protein
VLERVLDSSRRFPPLSASAKADARRAQRVRGRDFSPDLTHHRRAGTQALRYAAPE